MEWQVSFFGWLGKAKQRYWALNVVGNAVVDVDFDADLECVGFIFEESSKEIMQR